MGNSTEMVCGRTPIIDIAVTDGMVSISRNFEEALVVNCRGNKALIALLDAIINPGKYSIHVHDLRTKDIFSLMSFGFEGDSDAEDQLAERCAV